MDLDPQLVYAIQRLMASGQQANTILPLRLTGSIRVPVVNSLKVIRKLNFLGGTDVTLGWIEPEAYLDRISAFRIHLATEDHPAPTVVAEATKSPVKVTIATDRSQTAAFRVQTVLTNGQVSDFDVSPATSTQVASIDPQEIALVTYVPQPPVYDTLDLNTTSDTAVLLNTASTASGKLIGLGIRVLTTITTGGGLSPSTATAVITYGVNTSTIPLYYDNAGAAALNPALLAVPGITSSTGLTAGDFFFLPLGDTEFQNGANVTVSSTGQGGNAGKLGVTLLYANAL